MIDKILKAFKKEYKTLNVVEVSKTNLIHNYKYLSSLNKRIKIAPVLKSNAYGHGIVEVAKILDNFNAPFFCVDSLYEAYELLKTNLKTNVLIMGYTDPENFRIKRLPFSFAVFDLQTAEILNKYQKGSSVHIFVDTGMHREGVPLKDLPEFLNEMKKLSNLKIEGLMSHLASADNKNDPLNKLQIKNFQKALAICQSQGVKLKWIHLQNSDGLRLHLPGVNVNMARAGLGVYGISQNPNLKPVLSLKSKIIQIKNLQTGDAVGYNHTFIVKKPLTIGILPIGYYDGVDRRLSNQGIVLVNNTPCKILGEVSMNITTVDLTKINQPKVGQEMIIYSNNPTDKNSIESSAKICKTIPYDLLVNLATSTKRAVI